MRLRGYVEQQWKLVVALQGTSAAHQLKGWTLKGESKAKRKY
jgi:hypothetical protein